MTTRVHTLNFSTTNKQFDVFFGCRNYRVAAKHGSHAFLRIRIPIFYRLFYCNKFLTFMPFKLCSLSYFQFRLVFAYLSTYGGNLTRKERAYITISGFPKATVQVSFRLQSSGFFGVPFRLSSFEPIPLVASCLHYTHGYLAQVKRMCTYFRVRVVLNVPKLKFTYFLIIFCLYDIKILFYICYQIVKNICVCRHIL